MAQPSARPTPHAIRVTILSRRDCHLCHVVAKMARRLQAETPFSLFTVDVDEDAALAARYGSRIPVVLVDEREAGAGKVTEGQLRRAIKRARWRGPVSRILSRLRSSLRRG